MLVGYFDYFICVILITLNVLLWKKRFSVLMGWLIGFLLFGFVLPFVSMLIEIQLYSADHKCTDAFEYLYTYLKFPLYWAVGIVQGIIFGVRNLITSR
jgi:hypothetical protein